MYCFFLFVCTTYYEWSCTGVYFSQVKISSSFIAARGRYFKVHIHSCAHTTCHEQWMTDGPGTLGYGDGHCNALQGQSCWLVIWHSNLGEKRARSTRKHSPTTSTAILVWRIGRWTCGLVVALTRVPRWLLILVERTRTYVGNGSSLPAQYHVRVCVWSVCIVCIVWSVGGVWKWLRYGWSRAHVHADSGLIA